LRPPLFICTERRGIMSKKQALAQFQSELHISNSQIFAYLNCSLRYKLQYVEGRPMERVSIALPFGSAIHSAVERYYRGMKNTGIPESMDVIQEVFEDCLAVDLENRNIPVIFKKEMSDQKSAIEIGKNLLKAFYESNKMDGYEIVGIELPLTARLFTENGEATEFKLAGVLDLVFRDENGQIIVVDHKTASKPMAQQTADDDNQMTAYAYLLAANRLVFPTSEVYCRFDLLRKLKTPKLEHVLTTRTAAHRKRFAKLATAVLAGIDAGVFIPQPSWMCADCAYSDACKDW
jgi:putative RecB family exonuclease